MKFSFSQQYIHQIIQRIWLTKNIISYFLYPISLLFRIISWYRKQYLIKYKQAPIPPIPIVIIGNITVGGTGKTPVIAALTKALLLRGHQPGIISRGFGGAAINQSQCVTKASDPLVVGDEPVMLAHQLNVPIFIGKNRVQTACDLYKYNPQCTIILADDGLQHYRLKRDIEVVIIDGIRLLGNGECLPAGPLREPPTRLKTVDHILINSTNNITDYQQIQGTSSLSFKLKPHNLIPVIHNHKSACSPPEPGIIPVHGVAGIGNPQRFFTQLQMLGFEVIPHTFPDHYLFNAEDINFIDGFPVIMTEKDAIKCRQWATDNHWYLPVTADLPTHFIDSIIRQCQKDKNDI